MIGLRFFSGLTRHACLVDTALSLVTWTADAARQPAVTAKAVSLVATALASLDTDFRRGGMPLNDRYLVAAQNVCSGSCVRTTGSAFVVT